MAHGGLSKPRSLAATDQPGSLLWPREPRLRLRDRNTDRPREQSYVRLLARGRTSRALLSPSNSSRCPRKGPAPTRDPPAEAAEKDGTDWPEVREASGRLRDCTSQGRALQAVKKSEVWTPNTRPGSAGGFLETDRVPIPYDLGAPAA
ncbi:uncharacterized protein LOC143840273 [Paroedura picta]|uniref:uncharacterized protein LOC143840273 n=1 Tax=Paroedura picta TaxID=143630 RepID=UPI004056D864